MTALSALNLERAVFDIMGGIRSSGTSHDTAYGILLALTLLSWLAIGPLLVGYGLLVFIKWKERRRERRTL